MALENAGLKQVGICDKDSLATTPTNIILAGHTAEKTIKVTQRNQVTTDKNRKMPNQRLIDFPCESFQATMKALKLAIDRLNLGADVQILTELSEVFKFAGNNMLGYNFEYMCNVEKCSLNYMFKRALSEAAYKALVDSADSESAVDLNGAGHLGGEDILLYSAPGELTLESPTGTALFDFLSITDWSHSIKGKERENKLHGYMKVDYLTHHIEVTAEDTAITKLVALMNAGVLPSIKVKSPTTGAYYRQFNYAAGALAKTEEHNLGSNDRSVKLIFEADLPLNRHTFQFGDTYGGAALDDGEDGGTMNIAA